MAASKYPNTLTFLKKYGESVEQEIGTRLHGFGKIDSGNLDDSISYAITEENGRMKIIFRMADYGKYVDKGVKGSESGKAGEGGNSIYAFTNKMPPAKALSGWLKRKGLPESASFPIRRHIFRFGITPTNFFTIPTMRRQKQLENGIRDNMIKDIEQLLQKEFGKKK